jgi:hypothetical protein
MLPPVFDVTHFYGTLHCRNSYLPLIQKNLLPIRCVSLNIKGVLGIRIWIHNLLLQNKILKLNFKIKNNGPAGKL